MHSTYLKISIQPYQMEPKMFNLLSDPYPEIIPLNLSKSFFQSPTVSGLTLIECFNQAMSYCIIASKKPCLYDMTGHYNT